jgi:hypothetical protein
MKSPSAVVLRIGMFPQLSGPPEMPSAAAASSSVSISDEIDAVVESKQYTALPMPTINPGIAVPNGITRLEIRNDTSYALTILLSGPVEQRIEIAAGATVSAEMQAGTYRVVGRANAANVLPSYNQWQLAGAAQIRFYVQ